MMDVQFWFVLVGVAGVAIAVTWLMRRPRRAFTIEHIRVELHDAHVVDDRVVDAVWRAAISMTNNSRRPRALPVFAARATVGARHRVYLADVYLEKDATEVNPRDIALAWIEFVLPADLWGWNVDLVHLRAERPAVRLRFTVTRPTTPRPLASVR